jgi:hypothetical protein
MALLRHYHDDLQALIGATAATLGIDQVFVEKDFWSSRSCAPPQLQSSWQPRTVGGTR